MNHKTLSARSRRFVTHLGLPISYVGTRLDGWPGAFEVGVAVQNSSGDVMAFSKHCSALSITSDWVKEFHKDCKSKIKDWLNG